MQGESEMKLPLLSDEPPRAARWWSVSRGRCVSEVMAEEARRNGVPMMGQLTLAEYLEQLGARA
jgi:hypothetical protein